MSTTRPMTASPLAFARAALEAARAAVPAYGSKFSKRTDTRHQRAALLALRAFRRTDSAGGSRTCGPPWG